MQIGVSNPNVPIFPPRVCTLVLFIYLCRSKIFHTYMCGVCMYVWKEGREGGREGGRYRAAGLIVYVLQLEKSVC